MEAHESGVRPEPPGQSARSASAKRALRSSGRVAFRTSLPCLIANRKEPAPFDRFRHGMAPWRTWLSGAVFHSMIPS